MGVRCGKVDGVGFGDGCTRLSIGGGVLGEVVEMQRWRVFEGLMDGGRNCNGIALGLTILANDRYISAGEFLAGIVGCNN